jgi:hypothetical protein
MARPEGAAEVCGVVHTVVQDMRGYAWQTAVVAVPGFTCQLSRGLY